MTRAADPGSEETSAEAPRPGPQDTSAIPSGRGDVANGETIQLRSRPRTAVELLTIPESHYDRENEIARGGMGRIVAAWDRRLGRPVAIKELLRGTDELRRRFEREAVMTARLQHPAIINIYEAGRWPDGEPFYAMKRVDGRSLADAIQGTTSLNQRLSLLPSLITIVEAMAYAHGQHVIHRDLKPANVLLGSFGESVVIDWGLAKDLSAGPEATPDVLTPLDAEGGLTVSGTVMGTPAYMPPEQARGGALDERADVYALGAILYHLLAGQAPYSGQSSADVLKQVLESPPRPLDEREPAVPADLLAIVRKAMARDPAGRYRTAKDLAEDLKRFQTGQLVGAHEYTPGEMAQRWFSRHRAPASIAATAAVLLVITGVLAVQRIARERNEAQSARREAETRNAELVLNQARSSLRDDPTSAIAWLKNYPLDGPSWGAARMIAADARSQGVATRVFAGHEHAVNRIAFSLDGRLLASAGGDRTVRLWDAATAKGRVLKGHDWFVYSLRFSPDGKWIATAGGRMLWLWNVATGEGRSIRGPFMDKDLAFSPDGQQVVSVAQDEQGLFVHVWDVQTGFTRVVRDPADRGSRFEITDMFRFRMAISSDGNTLFALTGPETVRVWDLKTGRSRKLSTRGVLGLSPDGRLVATTSPSNEVRITETVGGVGRMLPGGSSGPVSSIAFSPDGRRVAAGAEDSTVRVWDLRSGEVQVLRGHSGEVRRLLFSPDSRVLGWVADDQTTRVWDLASGESRVLRGHTDYVRDIAFSADGRQIASAGRDRIIRLWSTTADDHRVAFRSSMPPEGRSPRMAFAPKGRVLAASVDGTSIRVFDLDKGVVTVLTRSDGANPHSAESPRIRRMVFSPDGKVLASADSDKTVRLWDIATGTSRTFAGHGSAVWDVAFSPDGARLASAGWDATVRIWNLPTGESRVLSGHKYPVAHVAFSPDGRSLVSASVGMRKDTGQEDLNLRLWDAATGEGRELRAHEDSVTDALFFADGKSIASASMDTTVRIWDAATGRVQRVLKGDGTIVQRLALSRDGQWVASGNDGGTTRLWNLRTGRSELLKGYEPSFSEDGATLAVSDDGVARLWDTATGEGRILPDAEGEVAISPDGKLVAVIGKDGAVHLWDDDLPREPAALKAWLQKATAYEVHAGNTGLGPNPKEP